ncbi:hypothetical protein PF008_g403 [Phytophthora fragariae]|uniref:HAT C-terminal dimerisation domain-containing protein n=1 Tax=Phytophthora fragariae TaxID=53985 RepID=A0A6G0SN33_9STRA|nr:hypothetical protein PF008_g403 [Phytophthora fragariae]
MSFFPLLQAVVLNVVCSNAAAERNFPTHKIVHSTMRISDCLDRKFGLHACDLTRISLSVCC